MTLLDRYYTWRLVSAIFRILISVVLLYIAIDLLTRRGQDFRNYGVPYSIAILYYLTFIPTILFEYQAAALAVLVAGLMVLGKSAQDNEITAVLAGGVSLYRILRAPVLVSLLVAITSFAVQETLGVSATATARKLEDEYFSRMVHQKNQMPVSWANLNNTWTCHVLKFNRTALTGQYVYMHAIDGDMVQEIRANRIFWDETQGAWYLEDGRWARFGEEWELQVDRITQIQAPFNETPDQLFALEKPPDTKSAQSLAEDLNHAAGLGIPVDRYWVDYHAKFARPALSFVMIFLAIPFAMRVRRGGVAVGFGLSIVIGLAYVLLFLIGMGLGYMETIPPLVAAWLANALFFFLGLVLLYRTPT